MIKTNGETQKSKDLPLDPEQSKKKRGPDLIVPDQTHQKALRDGAWTPLEKLVDGSIVYGQAEYDIHGKLVVLPGRRIYVGGQVMAEYSVNAQGKKDGEYRQYNTQGKLVEKCYYKNDCLDGDWIAYNSDGSVRVKGHYKNGRRTGKWKHTRPGCPTVVIDYGEDHILATPKAKRSLRNVLQIEAKKTPLKRKTQGRAFY